jgi:hypothetical protein
VLDIGPCASNSNTVRSRSISTSNPWKAPARFEQSLERWFNATELYPRQLREIDRDTYFAMKRSEYARQQTAQ